MSEGASLICGTPVHTHTVCTQLLITKGRSGELGEWSGPKERDQSTDRDDLPGYGTPIQHACGAVLVYLMP